nr:ATP-binding cassette domain-containing protein [Cryobacterium breve]
MTDQEVEPETEPVTAPEVEPETEPVTDPEVEPVNGLETESTTETETEPKPEVTLSSAVENETETATAHSAPPEPQPEAVPVAVPVVEPEPEPAVAPAAAIANPVSRGALEPVVLSVRALRKSFGSTLAVSGIDLEVRTGSFYGIVGPNGAGKTTTLSMVTGLLRPDDGSIEVHGIDVWSDPVAAKRVIGVLPDRLRLFDRLTGAQLLYYAGVLRGLDGATVRKRSADLSVAFGLEDALNRLVADYSAGMTKKIALACAMIHSPRLLVLDEPFESVDPVSAVNVTEILQKYVASGGTVVLSSHSMDLIQRVCDHVAIIVNGKVLAAGTVDEVRGGQTLEERFIALAGGRKVAEGMEWLHSFSD